jgi:enoyl-CoA hydratase/carnithine racemase
MNQLKTRCDGALAWIGIASTNNTIGSDLLRKLDLLLDEFSDPSGPRILIIHGTGDRFFSPGLDLYEVSSFNRQQISDLIQAFSALSLRLFTHSKRTLAMLNGHALAGGFLLASCCDARFGHLGVRVGLTALSRSLLMPFASTKILEYRSGTETAARITRQGLSFSAAEALNIGWMDGIFDQEKLHSAVKEKAAELVAEPGLERSSKIEEKRALAELIKREEDDHLERFLDSWFSPTTQSILQQTLSTLKRDEKEPGVTIDGEERKS